ncbi:alpha-tubulin N-acetyltransferase 1 isoform X1 [Pungitius pungitius]|uniref:alpha-tubulin N-acetyltransferase 1 isoform X1 n=1 Tax=Pungitius pungitius TaxID=134920 RepID=UPI0018883897|nr:alpha-tubulin N-acetyltransferase 1 isoform X1 [Pungitius pungitius]
MEFPFDINQLFSERVSILDQTLIAGRTSSGMPQLQAHIATVIDELGRASAKAQQLPASITSASKLRSQRHQLYLLKDGESNGGHGVAVGFLKVGYKKLFLLDRQGVHIEAEPLCVLDFYIAEGVQRHGYGLELFDFMLQHKNLEPVVMAYDRPSPKFLSFLAKHYCLTPSVPQANNFVVFEGFFLNRPGGPSSPLMDQGLSGCFGPAEKGSPQKAGRRNQTVLFNGERSGASGAVGSSLAIRSSSLPPAVGILPVLPLPQRGIFPQQGPPPYLPGPGLWGQQGPESTVPSHRALQSKTQQHTGSGCQEQPVQSAHGQQSCWTAGQTPTRSQPLSLPPPYASKKEGLHRKTSHGDMVLRGSTWWWPVLSVQNQAC